MKNKMMLILCTIPTLSKRSGRWSARGWILLPPNGQDRFPLGRFDATDLVARLTKVAKPCRRKRKPKKRACGNGPLELNDGWRNR